ncbi:DUF4468 domain-containing protein [Flavobacterium sp. GT3R68]|uniref:DUF4468 domain-containing protein n=1 Tax=Flavobacterium sp. GT3R68 TaxID=2594437 RepID=UPI000F8958BA|nr:DUF4468 domain-containing protein [Flavobacterium sp. GT3R68]RTY93877.1 DUF4468 domain-containing protein [Flavobacterium sp. GSN2]TRW93509.1 DUF4468 domain-containing protein [Flavobacterium sp. GT3R68]
MRKIILLSLLTLTTLSFGQETEFKFAKEGFTDYIITTIENKSQTELYKKTLEWIGATYKNPKEAIKSQKENEFIRFEGVSKSLINVNSAGKIPREAKYQIEITFKDGKYKLDVTDISVYSPPGENGAGGWATTELKNLEAYYNKKGETKTVYKYYPEMIPVFFNDLNRNLKDFILHGQAGGKKSDW